MRGASPSCLASCRRVRAAVSRELRLASARAAASATTASSAVMPRSSRTKPASLRARWTSSAYCDGAPRGSSATYGSAAGTLSTTTYSSVHSTARSSSGSFVARTNDESVVLRAHALVNVDGDTHALSAPALLAALAEELDRPVRRPGLRVLAEVRDPLVHFAEERLVLGLPSEAVLAVHSGLVARGRLQANGGSRVLWRIGTAVTVEGTSRNRNSQSNVY
jgi:hypothetical protein